MFVSDLSVRKLGHYGNQLIRITCPCDLYALATHFYIVKLGFTIYNFSSENYHFYSREKSSILHVHVHRRVILMCHGYLVINLISPSKCML